MLFVLKQTDAEQPVAHYVERLNEWCLHGLDISYCFNHEFELFRIIDYLHRIALLVLFDACKQRGMHCHCGLDGPAKPFSVQTAVQRVKIRYVITSLSLMSDTLHVETILYF